MHRLPRAASRPCCLVAGAVLAAIVGVAGCDTSGRSRVRALRPAAPLWRDPVPGTPEAPFQVVGAALPWIQRVDLDVITGFVAGPGRDGRLARDPCARGYRLRGPQAWFLVSLDGPALLSVRLEGRAVTGHRVVLLAPGGRCLASGARQVSRRVDGGPVRVVVAARGTAAGPVDLTLWAGPPRTRLVGAAWVTHYYLAEEADHEGEALDAPLLSGDCKILTDVPRAFHDDLCIEGSGRLRDGRIVNYDKRCTRDCFAALPCGRRPVKVCYRVLPRDRYPWGMGAEGRPLVPDRSVAVDPAVVPLGTVLYVPELDGVIPPGRTEPHDGCVRADDVGGAIRGLHIDFFAGTRARWRAWEALLPTRSFVTLLRDHPRCAHLSGTPTP